MYKEFQPRKSLIFVSWKSEWDFLLAKLYHGPKGIGDTLSYKFKN